MDRNFRMIPKPMQDTQTIKRECQVTLKKITKYHYVTYGNESRKLLKVDSYLEIDIPYGVTANLADTPVFLCLEPNPNPQPLDGDGSEPNPNPQPSDDDSSRLLTKLPTNFQLPTFVQILKSSRSTQTGSVQTESELTSKSTQTAYILLSRSAQTEVSGIDQGIQTDIDENCHLLSSSTQTEEFLPTSLPSSLPSSLPLSSQSSVTPSSTTSSAEDIATKNNLVSILAQRLQTFFSNNGNLLSSSLSSTSPQLSVGSATQPSSSYQLPTSSVSQLSSSWYTIASSATTQTHLSSSSPSTIPSISVTPTKRSMPSGTNQNPIELNDDEPIRKKSRVVSTSIQSSLTLPIKPSTSVQKPPTSTPTSIKPLTLPQGKDYHTQRRQRQFEPSKRIKCAMCNYEDQRDDLISHILSVHAVYEHNSCPLACGAKVQVKNRLKHLLSHFSLYFLRCHTCDRTFMMEKSFNKHYQSCYAKKK